MIDEHKKGNFFYHTLSNGIRLVLRQTASPIAYLGVMIGAGTRDEQPHENGMAHYIEHCVFKGTARHSSKQIINSIEGHGGEVNAYTTKEDTTFYAATLTEHASATLRLIGEMVTSPTFPKEETDKERTVIVDEIESYNDSPSELIYDDFENMLFAGHPLAMPILGTKKTLKHISSSPTYPQNWLQQHYRPERMVVFCHGNITPTRFVRMAENVFGAYSNNTATVGRTPFTHQATDTQRVAYTKHTHQTHVMLGTYAYPIAHPCQLSLYLLNNILGGGSLNSRLNYALREQRGLVYTIESTYTPLSDTGYWCTYFACEPEHVQQCLDVVFATLRTCTSTPLSARQLQAALRQLRGQMAISAQNEENNALSMAKSVLYRGYAPTWEDTYNKIAQLRSDELMDAAMAVLSPERMSILTYE